MTDNEMERAVLSGEVARRRSELMMLAQSNVYGLNEEERIRSTQRYEEARYQLARAEMALQRAMSSALSSEFGPAS